MSLNHTLRTIPLVLFLSIALVSISVLAQVLDGVPHLIAYQGYLTDTDGNPVVDGEHLITFTIWADSIGTSPTERKWISPDCPVQVTDGRFNWLLGSREGMPVWTMTNNADLWLGVKVGSDPELTPRSRLCSAPYAYKAWQADYAGYADSAGIMVSKISESGAVDGVVNFDMVEIGGMPTINFASPFNTVEKPNLLVTVVLKGAADGLDEGSQIRAVVDIKGSPGNWTGFDITVSKYSGGSITDTVQVFVIWMAVRP